MVVNTKKVANRRKVRYESYDDLLADVDQLASNDLEVLGNWSLAQNLKHLAGAFNGSIDGLDFKAPFFIGIMARLFMKGKFLNDAIPSGFSVPENLRGDLTAEDSYSLEEGLAIFKAAVARVQTESIRTKHPVLGNISREEYDKFNLRHAEMHLSFLQIKA
ncbi:MAG: DUF1569 domain-containing protein [Pirellulales bacterium]